MQQGYPQSGAWYPFGLVGWQSVYSWTLRDSCGNGLQGLDVNETFGTFATDYAGSNWGRPSQMATYIAGFNFGDLLAHAGDSSNIPVPQIPQSPLGNTPVYHDTPWKFYAGTLTFGSGVVVHTDTQQWWQDHGAHSAP